MRVNTGFRREGDYEHYTVSEALPLLEWLLKNVSQTKTKIKATLHGQGVKVNGKTVSQFDYQLEPGMKVAVSKTKRNQQGFKSRWVKIVYEDRWLIVVEKAEGILSMAAGHSTLNVKAVLDDYFKKSRQKCTAHVVHRLDRDTSGLMVYAKDMETEQILENNWHDIVYDRRYVAVCSGEIVEDDGTIQNWLKDNKAYVTYSSPVDNGGKLAITHWHVLDRTTEHSLVEFKLETGRKNQIRVHSADMGHPVCGRFRRCTCRSVRHERYRSDEGQYFLYEGFCRIIRSAKSNRRKGQRGAEQDPFDSLYNLQLLREGMSDGDRHFRVIHFKEHLYLIQ